MPTKSILITGGTGFLGSALTHQLLRDQYRVAILTRSAEKVERVFGSQVKAFTHVDDLPDAGQFQAIVNLAGAGIFDRPWTKARKQQLRSSRIKLTEKLANWIEGSNGAPKVFISGSAIGFYGDQGNTVLDELSHPKPDFAQQLCADWEVAAFRMTCRSRR